MLGDAPGLHAAAPPPAAPTTAAATAAPSAAATAAASSSAAVDAVAALLRAGCDPADPRLRTLILLARARGAHHLPREEEGEEPRREELLLREQEQLQPLQRPQLQPAPLAPAARALSFEPAQRLVYRAATAAMDASACANAEEGLADPRGMAHAFPVKTVAPHRPQEQQYHHPVRAAGNQTSVFAAAAASAAAAPLRTCIGPYPAPAIPNAALPPPPPPAAAAGDAAAVVAAAAAAAAPSSAPAARRPLMQPPPAAQLPHHHPLPASRPLQIPVVPVSRPAPTLVTNKAPSHPRSTISSSTSTTTTTTTTTTSTATTNSSVSASTRTTPASAPSSAASSLSADSIFQAKAQVAAYRAVARGIDPAPEIILASAGKRARPKRRPLPIPTAAQPARSTSSNPSPTSATVAATEAAGPAAVARQRRTIDDLPLYPAHYEITCDDVRLPGEVVLESALRQRVRRARARQNRIRAELVARGIPVPTVAISSVDIRALMTNLELPGQFESQRYLARHKQSHVELAKPAQQLSTVSSRPCIATGAIVPQSVSAATPIHVSSEHLPSDCTLQHGGSGCGPSALAKCPTHQPLTSGRRCQEPKAPDANGIPTSPMGTQHPTNAVGHITLATTSYASDPASSLLIPVDGATCSVALPISVPRTTHGVPFDKLVETRERRLEARIEARLSELRDLPVNVPEDIRRRTVIESKSLRLVRMQRAIRDDMAAVMHNLLAPPPPLGFGASAVAKYRHPAPFLHASASPLVLRPNGTVNGGALSKDARDRIRALEKRHREEQEDRRQRRQSKFVTALIAHATSVRTAQHANHQLHKKLLKDLERYFRDKAREEDRRKKREQQDRLRALRNNDEEQYLALLQNTKNTRLLQLLRQTDEYLSQLGACVEAEKEASRLQQAADREAGDKSGSTDSVLDRDHDDSLVFQEAEAAGGADEPQSDKNGTVNDSNIFDSGTNGDTANSVLAMRARRNQYYTITHSIKEQVFQPKSLVGGTLKPYQLDGLEWMVSLYNNGLNGILADEMGLGKTIQTISLLTYLVEVKANVGPFLVIVPLSTMSNWVRELETWAPSLVKVVYRGNPETRKNIQVYEMANSTFNVVLTTYEFVVKDKLYLGKIRWKYIIIDEGHRMKNADCKLAITLGAKYHTKNRILLTGTPLQNNLTELWALLNFLLPTIFSSADTFETWFNAPFQASSLGGATELNEEEQLLVISRLHQVLRPFMLRRLKTDVETQLPDKVESVLRCEMSVWQRVLYRQMTSNIGIASAGSVRTFNNIVMQLKKVCNHPYLFYNDEELMSVPRDYLVRASGKFELLEHAFRKLKASGHRVLMFSQMTAALDYLEYFLTAMGLNHIRLDGTTKADDRQTMLERFNDVDSKYFCFLLSTRAGGLGLNLQTADTVFIFDSDWNPMMDLQAQDRAHRIGQTKEVRVFRLITASSVEEKILERANQKLQMDAQIIQAGQFNNKSSDTDRTQMLKQILQSQAKGEEEDEDVPSAEELNRMLARSQEEFDLFQEMDRDRFEAENEQGFRRLMTNESELPAWVLHPETKKSSKEEEDMSLLDNHGRGRRKRIEVVYDDGLTDKEWTAVVEEDGDVLEASKRKRRRVTDVSEDRDTELSVGGAAEAGTANVDTDGDYGKPVS